ncbi:MAG: hypothetical protein Q7J03_02890 [Methanoregula sp.]|nr:hypothetical protein [Methanoregula sp.]
MKATPDIRDIIDKTILKYPSINDFVKKNGNFYIITKCRYGSISKEEETFIPEFTLAGVLFGSYHESIARKFINYLEIPPRQFTNQLKNLDNWLKKYSDYQTKRFRDKLIDNFFNSYSEIEFYDKLVTKGLMPKIDVQIGPGNNNLDFMINFNSHNIFIELTTRFEKLDTERKLNLNDVDPEREIFSIIQRKIDEQFQSINDENCIILAINIEYCKLGISLKMRENLLDYHPKNIYGLLLYREGRGQFYENPRYSLMRDEVIFFQNLFDEPTIFEKMLAKLQSEKK